MNWYVFKTAWGWSAIAFQNEGLLKEVVLPLPLRADVLSRIKDGARILTANADSPALALSERIQAYFEGSIVQDWNVQLDMAALTPFTRQVLEATRYIGYGHTCYYHDIAETISKPQASRAVGQALARNPLPLIIPCHRVIGVQYPGGFSAPGGIKTKQKLINWEKEQVLKQSTVWEVYYNTMPRK